MTAEHLFAATREARYLSDQDYSIWDLYAEAALLQKHVSKNACRVIDWCQRAHNTLSTVAERDPALVESWQSLILPYFMTSSFLERCRSKPRGYAGDYLTIERMYENEARGEGVFGTAVDRWALDQPCPRAVRNRRHLVTRLIPELAQRFPDDVLSIVSLGCGPAAEVFDALDCTNAHFTLVDIDEEALWHVGRKAAGAGLSGRIEPVLANIIKMTIGRGLAFKGDRHAFYSLGVIDYFSDDAVVRLFDFVHDRLRPGGIALFGNFRPGHPNSAFFQHALDWPLTLRSEDHLAGLVEQSRFSGSPVIIGKESEGVQLFVKCIKR